MASTSPSRASDGLPWPSSKRDLDFDKRLGRGYFGEVWQCKRSAASLAGKVSPTSTPWAVKKIPRSIIEQHGLSEQMEREIEIMREMRHPHIVELHFSFRDEKSVYLGMEFAEGGGMFDLLSKSGRFTNEVAAKYFFEVCDALEYLHKRKVIHRDIKPENILLDKEGHAKLADFGWSNVMENVSFRATFCCTPDYLAPEMIRGEGHNESLDMWEMGVLLYEMVIGKSPFGSSSQEATCRLILQVDLRFPAGTDALAEDLIRKLCKLRSEDRLTAGQAKSHAFVERYHGRPTMPLAAASPHKEGEQENRPSVEARHLLREKDILESETMRILQAKSKKESELLDVTERIEAKHQQLREEQRRVQDAELRLTQLKDREERQLREMQELKAALGQASPLGSGHVFQPPARPL